jgi:hypothetical protein
VREKEYTPVTIVTFVHAGEARVRGKMSRRKRLARRLFSRSSQRPGASYWPVGERRHRLFAYSFDLRCRVCCYFSRRHGLAVQAGPLENN